MDRLRRRLAQYREKKHAAAEAPPEPTINKPSRSDQPLNETKLSSSQPAVAETAESGVQATATSNSVFTTPAAFDILNPTISIREQERFRDLVIKGLFNRFPYSPVNKQKNEIRLLELEPGLRNDPLRFSLQTVSLDNRPPYEALSYTWGSQEGSIKHILDERGHFDITKNLQEALEHLRSEFRTRTLWIDAICIDQANDVEKSDQVQMMLQIYRQAAKVLIWLGPEQDSSNIALDLLERIGAGNVNFNEHVNDTGRESEHAWWALLKILERPWWSRVWVIQECAIHAEDPLVGCGDRWLPWSAYVKAYNVLREHRERSPLANAINAVYLRTLVNIRDAVQRTGTSLDLGNLLISTTIFDATNPRDKIYALYGLIHDVHQKKIIVDYSLTVSELYTRVGALLLSNNVNFLGYNTASPNHDLPSWVPDWSWKGDRNVMLGGDLYKAGGGPTVRPDADVDTRQLFVHASRLCRVGMIDPSPPSWSLTRAELLQKLESFEDTMQRAIRDYPNNQNVRLLLSGMNPRTNDALMRTVVADCDFTGPDVNQLAGEVSVRSRPAPREFWDALQVFQNRMAVPTVFEPHLDEEERKRRYTEKFVFNAQKTLAGSRFFIANWGLIGISHHSVRVGDYVLIVFDLDMPLLVRPAGPDSFKVVGVAYLHPMMDGEALRMENVEKDRAMLPGQQCSVCLE